MHLLAAIPFTGLKLEFEDRDSYLSITDVAEFVQLDKAIYDGEMNKRTRAVENWLGDLPNVSA